METEWIMVGTPVFWKPVKKGESIVGRFAGWSKRNGEHGEFEVASVRGDDGAVWELSGTLLVAKLKHAALRNGEDVKVVYTGYTHKGHNGKALSHPMREYEVFFCEKP